MTTNQIDVDALAKAMCRAAEAVGPSNVPIDANGFASEDWEDWKALAGATRQQCKAPPIRRVRTVGRRPRRQLDV